jgi:hypothetical protein
MIGRGALTWGRAVASFASLALVSACVDLFHSTDFQTLCDLDARAPGCPLAEAGPSDAADAGMEAAPTDFCSKWSTAEARTQAAHACAWIGACTAPFDQNAFGQCMINAILAYDCTTNPNLTIAPGPLHDYWDALWKAKSCSDLPNVNTASANCGGATGYACVRQEPASLLACVGADTYAETCLVEGKVCADLRCATPMAKGDCDPSSCEGTVLHACPEAGTPDEGYDCQYFGAGTCMEGEGFAGCVPATTSGGGATCPTGSTTTCDDGGVATGCPEGQSEIVLCDNLTGSGTCVGGTPSWNVAASCQGDATCTPGCDGDNLVGCAQGARFTTSCTAEGLGKCEQVKLPSGTGYACTPPP